MKTDEVDVRPSLYKLGWGLSLLTLLYNILEGTISMSLGYRDETLALFGFGADSFVEVISAAGVAVMIARILKNPDSPAGRFETGALRITGFAFYLLSVFLGVSIVVNVVQGHKPETTLWGIIISLVSIAAMIALVLAKVSVGRKLNSDAILADANCSKVCIYMSATLLISSLIYEFTGFAYADVLGAAGLVWFSISEGREAFEKARKDGE
jgi:divalent metal cation (Fe/Co/Zn/Cd) transporter